MERGIEDDAAERDERRHSFETAVDDDRMDEIVYPTIEEGRAGLCARGISDEVVALLIDAVEEASEALIDRYDLRSDVRMDAAKRALTIGTLEYVSEFVRAGVHDEPGVEKLARHIRGNEMNLSLVVGRMLSREREMHPIAAALHRSTMEAEER